MSDSAPPWNRVKPLLQAALDRPPEERGPFLDQACASDAALRREVDSLLVAHGLAGNFGERPADGVGRDRPTLYPGLRLGPYEVLEPLGHGGMGEVYAARDTRLGRNVAIKVLPWHVATDEDLGRRFEREARMLASLSHPHICPVFDVGQQDGIDYLVMERLDGETLAGRLARGRLPIERVFEYTANLASALETAHRHGVVHRDVKPGNIMLTKSGATLLDFGLAKRQPDGFLATNAAARAEPRTVPGAVVGTLRYMSPEQLQGRDADARSDIFSLGAVIYEMLTGTRAFDGDSAADAVAAVLEREPSPVSASRPSVPAAFERLLTTCLAKNPDHRWQSAGDLVHALALIADDRLRPASTTRSSPSFAWVVGALAIVVAAVTASWTLRPSATAEGPVVRSVVATPFDVGSPIVVTRNLALSPDGSRAAYAAPAGQPMRVLAFDQLEAQDLPGTEGGQSPTFSPDGRSIAYFDSRAAALKRLSIQDGSITTVQPVDGLLTGLTWVPDGTLVFSTERSDGLFRVAVDGGALQRLTTLGTAQGDLAHRWPSALPDGQGILFTAWRGSLDNSRLAVFSLRTRTVTYLTSAGSHPLFAPTGHIVFAARGGLRAVGFDPDALALTDESSVPADVPVAVHTNGAAHFDVSRSGSLVFVEASSQPFPASHLVWIDRQGRETIFTSTPQGYGTVRVSPDGTRIAATIGEGRSTDIWVSSSTAPVWNRLPRQPDTSGFGSFGPEWTPDGKRLVYQNDLGRLVWTAADGTGEVDTLLTLEGMPIVRPSSWTPDGQRIIVGYGTPSEIGVGVLSIASGADGKRSWTPLFDRGAKASVVEVSPRGRLIAYQSFDSGKYQVYVERFPQLGDRRPVSGEAGGFNPLWSRRGDELYYRRAPDGAMMAVSIRTSPSLEIGAPRALFQDAGTYLLRPPAPGGPGARYHDVAPDGRFLMVKRAPTSLELPSRFVHVQNWGNELNEMAPRGD